MKVNTKKTESIPHFKLGFLLVIQNDVPVRLVTSSAMHDVTCFDQESVKHHFSFRGSCAVTWKNKIYFYGGPNINHLVGNQIEYFGKVVCGQLK